MSARKTILATVLPLIAVVIMTLGLATGGSNHHKPPAVQCWTQAATVKANADAYGILTALQTRSSATGHYRQTLAADRINVYVTNHDNLNWVRATQARCGTLH